MGLLSLLSVTHRTSPASNDSPFVSFLMSYLGMKSDAPSSRLEIKAFEYSWMWGPYPGFAPH